MDSRMYCHCKILVDIFMEAKPTKTISIRQSPFDQIFNTISVRIQKPDMHNFKTAKFRIEYQFGDCHGD